ncbi:MAG: hypothetical protein RTV72_10545 [Candidatus Thorarchaeota archaeon]
MKRNHKHAFVILAMVFLFAAPAISAAHAGDVVIAQEIGEEFLFELLENGAEVVFASIDPQGVPAVVYGQLGIPSDDLGLEQTGAGQMYEGCIAMVLLATQGELLDYLLDLVGGSLFNLSGDGGGMSAAQFGGEEFDMNSILDMIGTEFSLLINVFVDLTEAQAQVNMGAIRTHLHTEFNFNFAELLNLRLGPEFFGELGMTLPFDAIHFYVHKITNPFEDAVGSVLSVMDQTGFINAIDQSVFETARASGAGMLAIPDLSVLMDLIEGFGGGFDGGNLTASSFLLSQMPELDGPIAVVGAGYIGDQILSITSDEINVFKDLLGKAPLVNINGLSTGQSLIGVMLPPEVNVTSYSPFAEVVNQTYYSQEAGVVFWNASAFSDVSDYSISFEDGAFPPLVRITRSFTPDTLASGGSVTVQVSVHNEGTEPIENITIQDTGFSALYPNLTITGTQTTTSSVIDANEWLNITYTATFVNEGGYLFHPASVTYEYDNTTYSKTTHIDGYTVTTDLLGLLQQMIVDGMPYTGIMIGIVGLGAIVNIGLMARGKGGGGSYQV